MAHSRRRALAGLCVGEVVSYGVLYYAFPVLADDIAADTGWSRTAVVAAYSTGILVGAVAGIPARRLRGPRPVMTAGSAPGVLGLLAVAAAPTYLWFLLAWSVTGVATAGVFYPPAFAAITAWYGDDRLRALTVLTLVAGFASTIFAPLTAWLAADMSWREAYVVLAGVLAVLTIPTHALLLRLPWTSTRLDHARATVRERQIVRSRPFLVLALAMTLSGYALYAVIVNVLALLTGRGMSPTLAAWALGLGGAGQVGGRLCYRLLTSCLGVRGRAVAVIAIGTVATLLFALVPGPAVLLVVISVVAGAGRGLFTLVEATIVADRWGAAGFARLNGIFHRRTDRSQRDRAHRRLSCGERGGRLSGLVRDLGWGRDRERRARRISAGGRARGYAGCGVTCNSPIKVRTRCSISSRTGRTASTSKPAGSSSTHSS